MSVCKRKPETASSASKAAVSAPAPICAPRPPRPAEERCRGHHGDACRQHDELRDQDPERLMDRFVCDLRVHRRFPWGALGAFRGAAMMFRSGLVVVATASVIEPR